jgi:tetratricopeptide (TPR) repeat protein
LITECLSAGGDSVAPHERFRDSIFALARSGSFRATLFGVAPGTHGDLARYHAQLDGTPNPATSKSVVDWLERAHHLAGAGLDAAQAWSALDLRCREFYWDRARALSLQRHFEPAAAVYRECLKRFGENDAYAQHYLGFNLDRAGIRREEAESALRRAVEVDPSNPWWNTRLVTFLIDQVQFLEARRQWLRAIAQVDPTGELVGRDPWMARHMHRWVVTDWLDHGEVELAREAFDSIPRHIVQADPYLSRLGNRLVDAEEAHALGNTVYPPFIPPEERWQGPRLVPDTSTSGSPRRAWYPGRVVQATDDAVVIVFAIPNGDPQGRRVMTRELDAATWKRAANRPPASATGFIEIGSYENGELVVEVFDDRLPAWDRPLQRDPLRYMGRWGLNGDTGTQTH